MNEQKKPPKKDLDARSEEINRRASELLQSKGSRQLYGEVSPQEANSAQEVTPPSLDPETFPSKTSSCSQRLSHSVISCGFQIIIDKDLRPFFISLDEKENPGWLSWD